MGNLNTNKGKADHAKRLQKIYGTPQPKQNDGQEKPKAKKGSKK